MGVQVQSLPEMQSSYVMLNSSQRHCRIQAQYANSCLRAVGNRPLVGPWCRQTPCTMAYVVVFAYGRGRGSHAQGTDSPQKYPDLACCVNRARSHEIAMRAQVDPKVTLWIAAPSARRDPSGCRCSERQLDGALTGLWRGWRARHAGQPCGRALAKHQLSWRRAGGYAGNGRRKRLLPGELESPAF